MNAWFIELKAITRNIQDAAHAAASLITSPKHMKPYKQCPMADPVADRHCVSNKPHRDVNLAACCSRELLLALLHLGASGVLGLLGLNTGFQLLQSSYFVLSLSATCRAARFDMHVQRQGCTKCKGSKRESSIQLNASMPVPLHTLEPAWSAAELALSCALPVRSFAWSWVWPAVSLAWPVKSLALLLAASLYSPALSCAVLAWIHRSR